MRCIYTEDGITSNRSRVAPGEGVGHGTRYNTGRVRLIIYQTLAYGDVRKEKVDVVSCITLHHIIVY